MHRVGRLCISAVILVSGVSFLSAAAAPPPKPAKAPAPQANGEFFETRVRPVLAAQCVKCHGPVKQLGGLRLDSRQALLKGGARGPSITPGKPEKSLLLHAVRHQNAAPVMPPG
ncbi:MAG: c-type cytochrome domain-containing protein, partial [Actinomycetota bacterium]